MRTRRVFARGHFQAADPLCVYTALACTALRDSAGGSGSTMLVLSAGRYRPIRDKASAGHSAATIAALVRSGAMHRIDADAVCLTRLGLDLSAELARRDRVGQAIRGNAA